MLTVKEVTELHTEVYETETVTVIHKGTPEFDSICSREDVDGESIVAFIEAYSGHGVNQLRFIYNGTSVYVMNSYGHTVESIR